MKGNELKKEATNKQWAIMSLLKSHTVYDDLDSENVIPFNDTTVNKDSCVRPSYFCNRSYDCAPGLLSLDSEESSFSSCGTEEFFDFEELSGSLNLIGNWHKLHRRVRFSSIHVQVYAIIVGDHPICRDGLALSLDWSHSKEQIFDIDDFEFNRRRKNQRKGIRRRVSKLDYWQRREIFNRVGCYSNTDLSRIECQRNQEAVSDFLLDAGSDDFGPSQEEEGFEQVYDMSDGDSSPSPAKDGAFYWQMKIQILE